MKHGRGSIQVLLTKGIYRSAHFLLFILACGACYCQRNIQAREGILDLRNRDWQSDGIADLKGEWEFYWKELYKPAYFDSDKVRNPTYATVPGFWNNLVPGLGMWDPAFGYATYKLKVLCPPATEDLQLKFLTVSSAYRLFVNGSQVAAIGQVGTSKATTQPAFMPLIVPVKTRNNELDIVIQVSNYTYNTGGLWDFIKLGPPGQVQTFWIRNLSVNFFIAGSFFLMGIFYFVIYFFFRRRLSPLYFGAFCILLAIRPLVTDELGIKFITHWSWQLVRHIEYLSLYLAVPVLSLFSYELFTQEFSKRVLKIILIVSIPFILFVLFTSPFIFRYTLRPFQVYMLVTACYGVLVYGRAVKNKRPGSVYFLVGFILLFITFVNDLLYTSLVIESVHLVYAGLFIFIVSQAIALSKQFFWTFSRLEIVNTKLAQINDELNYKNITINEANDQLTKLNAELDSLVYRTSHDLRSPVASVLTLVEIIKEEKDPGKRNEYLSMQTKTLYRLDALIAGTLDFAKNKRIGLNYEPVDFSEFVHNILQDHMYADNSGKIDRIVEIDQKAQFATDKIRLNIVLNNLVSNAIRYHNTNKDQPFVKILVQADDIGAKIQVADNGQGIDEKHIDHIFTMFYRANTTSGGSGIGLYIVKEAIEKLGGNIKIESRLHEGTTFTIMIPNYTGD
jgi:signal transduction histidine kinase